MNYIIAYLATAVVFFALDFVWLSYAGSRIYKPLLGDMMLDSPNLPVAGLFYLIYTAGIVVFAVSPSVEARPLYMTVALGAFLGLVAYGTYDITNLSTLKNWPVAVSVIDLAWGTFVTGIAALGGALALRFWGS